MVVFFAYRRIGFFTEKRILMPGDNNSLSFFPKHPLERELLRSLDSLIKKYHGKRIDISSLSAFQRDGMKYYTDFETYNGNTDIGITLNIDVTRAAKIYEQQYSKEPGATFTLYLMWTLIKAMQITSAFNYRFINGYWYEFANLPLFTTAAVSGELNNLKLNDVVSCEWPEFCQKFTEQINSLKSMGTTQTFPYPEYAIAMHITNIQLPFHSISIPAPKKGIEIERPMFVMGQRIAKEGKVFMPFYAKLPHASLHPGLFRKLLQDWDSIRGNVNTKDNLCIRARL